jgi:hypothetical protein
MGRHVFRRSPKRPLRLLAGRIKRLIGPARRVFSNLSRLFAHKNAVGLPILAGQLHIADPGKQRHIKLAAKHRSIGTRSKKFTGKQYHFVDLNTASEPIFSDMAHNLRAQFHPGIGHQLDGKRRAGGRVFTKAVTVAVQVAHFVQQGVGRGHVVGPFGGICRAQPMVGRGIAIPHFRLAKHCLFHETLSVGTHGQRLTYPHILEPIGTAVAISISAKRINAKRQMLKYHP